jgi:aldehyde dehydrogenase (NAD+)
VSTPDYTSLVQGQRRYFKMGKTKPVSWRVEQLKAIKAVIEASRNAMRDALWHDLRRNETNADLMDIDINVHEAEFALAHLHDWVNPRHEATPIVMEPGHVCACAATRSG